MDFICIPIHFSNLYTLIVVTRGYSMQPYLQCQTHVHRINHFKIVVSQGQLCQLLAFTRV